MPMLTDPQFEKLCNTLVWIAIVIGVVVINWRH